MRDIKQILIVDSNKKDQAIFKKYLSQLFKGSVNVVVKEKSSPALNFLRKNQVDCILLNYQLLDMKFGEFVNKINDLYDIKPPVIMFYEASNERHVIEALKLGVCDYLIKDDLSAQLLFKAIKSGVEKSQLTLQVKMQETKIKYMAYHDYLTGIPNRLQFEHLAEQAVARCQRHKGYMAILLLDLDRFKKVNDTLGHECGDELLKKVTERLSHVLRKGDVISRFGGDEFAVILELSHAKEAGSVAQKLIDSLRESFDIKHHSFSITASIGIAVYPEGGKSVSDLVRNADTALYQAKAAGKNTYQYFNQELTERLSKRLKLEARLRYALNTNGLLLSYQPIYDLDTREIYAVEALLRWNDEEFGEVSPRQIISVAEESALIVTLGQWIMEESLKQYKIWLNIAKKPFKLALNLSPQQLHHKEWLAFLENTLKKNNILPENIIFELIETKTLYEDYLRQVFDHLVHMGISIFIDDFGTGCSSLSLLRAFPISGVKIDCSFVQNIDKGQEDAVLVKSIVTLAENLGLYVIAEGIENKIQLEFMKKHRKQKAQGFYLSKPLTQLEIEHLLKNANSHFF